jgi:sarcosine oxidase subunit alpha
MIYKDVIIIGGGPAGLSAAKMFKNQNISVLIVDQNPYLGGQLKNQTHIYRETNDLKPPKRGFELALDLIQEISNQPNIELLLGFTLSGLYKDHVMTVVKDETYLRYKAKVFIIATGTQEKSLAFEENDLPGIMGASTIQKMMHVYGIMPESDLLMVGSGNVSLIVANQLCEAGVNVVGIIDSNHTILGDDLHVSMLKERHIPFYMNHQIKRANGTSSLESVEMIKLDEEQKPLHNQSKLIPVKTLCIATGLSPFSQPLSMMEVDMKYDTKKGGFVPLINQSFQTSNPSIYACGDVTGVENYVTAILEGSITGLNVLDYLEQTHIEHETLIKKFLIDLEQLRIKKADRNSDDNWGSYVD